MREGVAINGSFRRVLLAPVLVFLLLLVPATASAGWSTPQNISGLGTNTSQTRIAGGSDGTSWVVWKRNVAGFDVIQGTRVTSDGSAGPVQTLSSPIMDATDPVIAARPDGSAMVAWLNLSALDDTVVSRSIAGDGTLGPIETRSAVGPAGQPAADIDIALGSDGSAGIAWRKYNGSLWTIQAVKIAADGTSGTIHDLSDTANGSADVPDIAASGTNTYVSGWAQGAGATANVYSREINTDDTLAGLYTALSPASPGTGGDPHDVNVVFGRDGLITMGWIRYRTDVRVNGQVDDDPERKDDDPDDTPYSSWTVEQIRAMAPGPLNPDAPLFVSTLAQTPVVEGAPIVVDNLRMIAPAGSLPILMWQRDQGGGTSILESARYLPNNTTFGWGSAASGLTGTEDPVFVANNNQVGIIGWETPSASSSSWTRFSNSLVLTETPAGFDDITDPGFVISDTNVSLAAFTGTSGGVTGTMLSVFTDPNISKSPAQIVFGRINLGFSSNGAITVRSSGETPGEVTGIELGGPDAGEFSLVNDGPCVGELIAGGACTFSVRFSPRTAGSFNATVTVKSPTGDLVTNLTGSGGTGTRLQMTATPRNKAVRKGKVVRINATVKNLGLSPANQVKVCANLNQRVLKLQGNRCRTIGQIPGSAQRRVTFAVRVTWRAKRGTVYPVTMRARSSNAVQRLVQTRLRRKGN